jgi:hypothetical protein
MKTVSDDLFRLIKALNKSEKGYFKKFAAKSSSGSKQNYIVLFDAIERMDSYDEDLLRKMLAGEPILKQLPVYKVYLFNLILKSLNQYGAFETSSDRIRDHLENSKTLSSKALFKEAMKQLKKAKEIAVKFGHLNLLLEILIAERNIITVSPDRFILENREKIYEEQRAAAKLLLKNFEYSWLSDQMVICVEQQGDFAKHERLEEMEKIISSPLISDSSLADDLNMKFYRLHTQLFYYLGKNSLKEVSSILREEIELLEGNRHYIEDNPKNYASVLINFLLFSHITGSRSSVLEAVVKLNRLRKKLKNKVPLSLELHILFHAANTELLIYRNTCDMKKGRVVMKRIETELPKYTSEIPPQLRASLLSNSACFSFLDEDFESALKMNNRLLEETGITFRSDVHFFAKLFDLLIHYELGNIDLLEYHLNSTYKFFKDKGALHKPESLVIESLKRAVKSSPDEAPEIFGELHHKLSRLNADTHMQNLFSIFDLVSWARSKAEGKKLVDVRRELKT